MDELALDIFETDDFKPTTMTEMVGDVDVVPGEIEARGYFIKKPVRTETITFIKKDRTLELVPTSERGTPENLSYRQQKSALRIEGPRLALRDRVSAREAANLLSPVLPYQVRLDNANDLVAERQADQKDRINLTREVLRFGALTQAKLIDADGVTVIADFYELMDIPEPAEIALNIAGTPNGQLRQKIENLIVRPMRRALKGRWRGNTSVHAFVGDAFFSDLMQHNDVRETYLATQAARELRDPTAWTSYTFAGVTFENWWDDNHEELAIGTDKARFFPVNAADTFYEYLAPGEDWTDIGQLGEEWYSIVSPDNRINMKEHVDIYTRTYPFPVMKAPQALMKARRGN